MLSCADAPTARLMTGQRHYHPGVQRRPAEGAVPAVVAYPQLDYVEFGNASRTEARAGVTIGYSGAVVVLEKVDGVWRALRLTGWWIT